MAGPGFETTASNPDKGRWFATTRWSVVLAAGSGSSPEADAALERLCRAYWYPLYAYARRKGHSPEDAQDFTQEFFSRLLSKNQLAGVDRRKGKFRSWLLGVMNHFLAHEWEKSRAQKRGGGQPTFSLDELTPEDRYRLEPADDVSPQTIFDRRWALVVLSRAAERLRAEQEASGRNTTYDCLKQFVSGDGGAPTYAEAARQLGLTEGGAKAAVHRLRQRYQELIREEIAHTVTNAAEVDEEIRYLLAVMRG